MAHLTLAGVSDDGKRLLLVSDDGVEHTLTADAGTFESPLIKPGEQWSFRFATAGTYAYHCMPHPFMKAEVRVKAGKP